MTTFALTAEELARLPPILREIVEVDREILIERSGDSIDFRYLGELRKRRRELTDHIARGGWGTDKGDTNSRPPAAAVAA